MLSFLLSQPRSRRQRARLAAAHAALRRANLRADAWTAVASARVDDGRAVPLLLSTLDGLRHAAACLRVARLHVAAAELGVPHAA